MVEGQNTISETMKAISETVGQNSQNFRVGKDDIIQSIFYLYRNIFNIISKILARDERKLYGGRYQEIKIKNSFQATKVCLDIAPGFNLNRFRFSVNVIESQLFTLLPSTFPLFLAGYSIDDNVLPTFFPTSIAH